MLENTWYSVISPEGCASILWHDAKKAKQAAEALKLIPTDLVELGICDRIVQEPTGGAHDSPKQMFEILKIVIIEELKLFEDVAVDTLFDKRIEKYDQMGSFVEQS